MVENLDELLEALESDDQKTPKQPKRTQSLHRSELSLDVSDLLTLDVDAPPVKSNAFKKSITTEKIKCCPTFISGTQVALKFPCSPASRTCSALHCRNCDFPVSSFPNHEWTEQVEYLFLRTNMPDFKKVQEKLRQSNGSVAYACHCVCFSADHLQPLHETNLPWFCRGHVQSPGLM